MFVLILFAFAVLHRAYRTLDEFYIYYFRWQPSTLLQIFIHLSQSAAVLFLFVQKFKMAAAAILDFIFV